jgi:hypothetical protein
VPFTGTAAVATERKLTPFSRTRIGDAKEKKRNKFAIKQG